MKAYLLNSYSEHQVFTREHLKIELLLSTAEARQLQERVIGNLKPMSFNAFVSCVEYALEHENAAEVLKISHYQRHIA